MLSYEPKKIEEKWQKKWEEDGLYKAENFSEKEKKFILIEFPYPSGAGLHVGHTRSYTALDVISRKLRMHGKNVLYPIGWDAFGLPTENYAIKNKIHPRIATEQNICTFTKQIKSLGISFDWSREIDTTNPFYYKWTQWIFLKLFQNGLAYKASMPINWCPLCKIGLANEEVVDGKCERCGADTEKREKEQWMLAITKYADRLIDDLETVDYLEKIKNQQINWIGRSEGVLVKFKVQSIKLKVGELEIFTTRPDTLFGCTYLVVCPEHEIIRNLKLEIRNWEQVEEYIGEAKRKSDLQRTENKGKTGVKLESLMAINPVNNEEIPIYVADYVLSGYGTGAIMAVPAHDERDFEFAKKYGLPIKQVIAPYQLDETNPPREGYESTVRNVVHIILENKNGEILTLHLKGEEWGESKPKTFIIGGIENGETPAQAAIREVKEETGYIDFEVVKVHPVEFHAEFFAKHKKLNRYVKTTGVVCKLKSEKKVATDEKEKKLHNLVWVKRDIISEAVSIPDDIFLSKAYINNIDNYTGSGVLINSGKFSRLSSNEAKEKIIEWLKEKDAGERKRQYHLRDWVFSRQHYWGEPIPVVHCEHCGTVALLEDQLPLILPEVENYEPTDTGESPLANITEWVNTICPKCGGAAKRETDTMPNWAGSSWYFLRYIDPKNNDALADMDKLKYWMPVDLYNGGMEHTTLHLLYSRFWNKFLYDLGIAPFSEPYAKRVSHGMVLAEDGKKMSKSLGNVINPDDVIREFGADTLRVYEMFMGPYGEAIPWSADGLKGVKKFLDKVWGLRNRIKNYELRIKNGEHESAEVETRHSDKIKSLLHKTVKKVTEDIENFKFNTAISAMMILANEMEKAPKIALDDYKLFILILSPFAPHICEEIWERLQRDGSIVRAEERGEAVESQMRSTASDIGSTAPPASGTIEPSRSIFTQQWPEYDPNLAKDEEIELVVQINGKVRDKFVALADISEEEAKKQALERDKVGEWIKGKEIVKVIFVKGKLVNIVVR